MTPPDANFFTGGVLYEPLMTPMGGVLVRPLKSLSFYANYIEGLLQGDASPRTFLLSFSPDL